MSYEVKYTSRFKRDYKRMKRRGKDVQKLLDVIDMLREGQTLPPPSFRMVLVADGDFAYRRKEDGIVVCPIGSLKP